MEAESSFRSAWNAQAAVVRCSGARVFLTPSHVKASLTAAMVETEILELQVKHRLAHFAQPDDATVRKVIIKNERRILAVHLHVRSGYGGAALARFFKVPRSTAYGWLEWFESLPEGVQAGILAFMDTQVPVMAACQVPRCAKIWAGSTQKTSRTFTVSDVVQHVYCQKVRVLAAA